MHPTKTPFKSLLILCVFCILGSFLAGCDTTSADRVAAVKGLLNQAAATGQQLDTSIVDIQQVVTDSQLLLVDPNVPDNLKPAIQKVLETASAKLTALQQAKQKVTTALAQYQAVLAGVDINDIDLAKELQLYAVGAAEVGKVLPQPYGGYVYLGSALAALLAGLLGSISKNIKQSKQLDQSKAVLTEVVTSVDELLSSDKVDTEAAKQILQGNQSGATQDAVDAIHDPMENTGPAK